MNSTPETRPLRFFKRGRPVSLANVPPTRTVLEVLREDLGLTGTKEGCGEGDCGACTVVLGEAREGRIQYRAINSCIRLAHSIDGLALWTVEDLAGPGGQLHPAQQAMVDAHGSQCGFCTPGFVMSLYGMYRNHVAPGGDGQAITRTLAQEELSGNLCRCTGYRPILDAAQQMAALPPPPDQEVDTAGLLSILEQTTPAGIGQTANLTYFLPATLPELLQLRAQHPQAQLVAGCTDAGLWVTKQHRQFAQVLDLTRVDGMRQIRQTDSHLSIGAAATLQEAFTALTALWPDLRAFACRFAGLPVRNSGTLGGNVANGSPIGDSMPLLLALEARLELAHARQGEVTRRRVALEDFYTGYRRNVMAPDEVLTAIEVPLPAPGGFLRVYKVSKRYDDDISAVCLAIYLQRDATGRVTRVRLGAGGVAATPVRAMRTEAALAGQAWTADTVAQAQAVLQAEFEPLSDMRASALYRRTVLGNLLQRFWLETQGQSAIRLESLAVLEDA